MEVLVYIDQSDKDLFAMVEQACKLGPVRCQEMKSTFWHQMIDRYPTLKNRRLSINIADGYIFQWSTHADLTKANTGHV